MKELPSGWTIEDIEFLLMKLYCKERVLVADNRLGIPTIHGIPNAEHIGFGVLVARCVDYEVSFCGGGAMDSTPSGQSWTVLSINRGEYPYDAQVVRRVLLEYLPEPATLEG